MEKEQEPPRQPNLAFLVTQRRIMPDGSIGCVQIGEAGGDRSKDLELTMAQARTLAEQIRFHLGDDAEPRDEPRQALFKIQMLAESSQLCGDKPPAVSAQTLLDICRKAKL
jgi:hypothetical protein